MHTPALRRSKNVDVVAPLAARKSARFGSRCRRGGASSLVSKLTGAETWRSQRRPADEPPVIELRNVSKSFGEVRSLSGVNFKVNRRELSAFSATRVGQVNARQGRNGVPDPDPGGAIYFHGKRMDDWSVARARVSASKRSSGAGALRKAADPAQDVHGVRKANASGPPRPQRDARRGARPTCLHMASTSAAVTQQRRCDDVRRRRPGVASLAPPFRG